MNIKDIINKENIIAKKKFGQNFLIDHNILKNIILSAQIKNANVIEIGPGLGSLTDYLVRDAKKVLCYEIDEDMIEILNSNFTEFDNIKIINQDFLKCNLEQDIEKYFNNEDVIIVANLPYYITTPIITKVLEETKKVKRMVVMVQKEVAMRICGKPSTKDYNSLSVLIQYYTNVRTLFDVSPKCFIPEPGVMSSVILIEKKEKLLELKDEDFFLKLNRIIFSQRRKTLYNNIKGNLKISKEELEHILLKNDLSLNVRAESLSIEQIVKLANDLIH